MEQKPDQQSNGLEKSTVSIEDREDFVVIKEIVSNIVFTNIDLKRQYFQKVLDELLGEKVSVESTRLNDQIISYIKVGDSKKIIAVDSYPISRRGQVELVPTVEELEKYKKFVS